MAPATRHRDDRLPPRTRRIAHLDVDAFLASVEQARLPELRGRAVVVGGPPSSRNLVMSCSYEARALGVHPGMPLRRAAEVAPTAVFCAGSATAATRYRERAAELLMHWSPLVEVTSIDDFLVDLTGTSRAHGAAFDAALAMRAALAAELHLPVTIGIGTTCTIARLAGKTAKPGGVAEILPGHERAFLDRLPVAHLPGVGRSIGAQLERYAVRTVADLRLVSREVLFTTFGRPGLVVHARAHGRCERRVEPTWVERDGALVRRPPRSISRETTFEPEEGARERVEAMLAYLVERAASRLRSHGHAARSLEVRLSHAGRAPSSSHRRRARIPGGPSDSTSALSRHALALLRSFPVVRALVKRVGVTLVDLVETAGHQGGLFAPRADRHRRLDDTLDELRERVGFGRVLRGSTLPLAETHRLTRSGFRLRTPSLNQ